MRAPVNRNEAEFATKLVIVPLRSHCLQHSRTKLRKATARTTIPQFLVSLIFINQYLSSTMIFLFYLFLAVRADPKVRQAVAGAIIKALTASDIATKADIPTDKLVVRFSES